MKERIYYGDIMHRFWSWFPVFAFMSIYLCLSCDEEERNLIQEIDLSQYGRNDAIVYTKADTNIDCGVANNRCVSSKSELVQAVNDRISTIILKDGTYDLGVVDIDYPVTLKAASLWGAILNGSSYLSLKSNDIVVEGIRFEDGASPSGGLYAIERHGSIEIRGDKVNLINNYFENIGEGSTTSDRTGISVHIFESDDVVLENNIFHNSHGVATKADDFSKRLIIKNNTYTDSFGFGGAGEVIHFGNANSASQGVSSEPDDTFSQFKNNYVRNWNLELELISVKSDKNIIADNYFENCGNSGIVIRMGNDNVIERNIMIGNLGFPIRISGERNNVINNTFCGKGRMVSLHSERVYLEDRPNLYNSYWAANNTIIEANTFFGYSEIIHNNVDGFSGDPDRFEALPSGNVFRRNTIYFNDTISTILPTGVIAAENQFMMDSRSCLY